MGNGPVKQGRGRAVGIAATMPIVVVLALVVGLVAARPQGAGAGTSSTPSGLAVTTSSPSATPLASATPAPTPVPATPAPSTSGPAVVSPTPSTAVSRNGVVWTRLDSPASVWFEALPGGYVATSNSCWDPNPGIVFTSPDGISWTTPPDPRIFSSSDEGFCLTVHAPAHGPAGYLLAGRVTNGVTTIWRSGDGIGWQRIAVPSLRGAELSEIASTAKGYLAADGGHDNYWTSSDGVKWTPAATDAFKLETGVPGEPLFAGGESQAAWFSLDGGRTWARTGFPKGSKLLQGIARLGKLYYGNWSAGAKITVYSSPDLRRWTPLKCPGPMTGSVVAFGNRLYVVNYGETLTGAVYSSTDGRAWSPVKAPSGQTIQANSLRVVDGRLFVLDGAILWVASID